MSEAPPIQKKRGLWGPRRWHRCLGVVLALPLLWLCVTGLLLQHQEGLGLAERKVSSGWLLKRYKQVPAGEPREARAGRFTVSEWGGVLFFDGQVLEEGGTLVGAVAKPAELILATENAVFVYDSQGSYLDRLGEESLPAVPVARIGRDSSGRVILEAGGGSHVLSDDFLSHEKAGREAEVVWSVVTEAGGARAALQAALAEGAGFTWGRVVTDLHSGRLFGKPGRFLVDLTAVAVIVLTLFGIRLFFKRT